MTVRLVWPDERCQALMNEHHYLSFRNFAGRGLRYVAEGPKGEWLALAGWQTEAFRYRSRDRWIG